MYESMNEALLDDITFDAPLLFLILHDRECASSSDRKLNLQLTLKKG
jgi:hypothetical protein